MSGGKGETYEDVAYSSPSYTFIKTDSKIITAVIIKVQRSWVWCISTEMYGVTYKSTVWFTFQFKRLDR